MVRYTKASNSKNPKWERPLERGTTKPHKGNCCFKGKTQHRSYQKSEIATSNPGFQYGGAQWHNGTLSPHCTLLSSTGSQKIRGSMVVLHKAAHPEHRWMWKVEGGAKKAKEDSQHSPLLFCVNIHLCLCLCEKQVFKPRENTKSHQLQDHHGEISNQSPRLQT